MNYRFFEFNLYSICVFWQDSIEKRIYRKRNDDIEKRNINFLIISRDWVSTLHSRSFVKEMHCNSKIFFLNSSFRKHPIECHKSWKFFLMKPFKKKLSTFDMYIPYICICNFNKDKVKLLSLRIENVYCILLKKKFKRFYYNFFL